ncbi:hypothetical protein [Mucilaginibacter sp. OK268]|uniref:hypothetical protein n=1 Tax=Mucilaginibacter sp. OK268 TaxID=1881048 RepID=UPI00115FF2CA|nr:hypothetical protein [Mucilaginibacter sp. OK268]
MIQLLLQRRSANFVCLFLIFALPTSVVLAQQPTTVKAPVEKKATKPNAVVPAINNKIIIGSGYINAFQTLTNIPTTGKPSIWYSVINVPFIISGGVPKNNIPVKLKIISYTSASPQFLTQTGPSASDNEVILKNQFNGTTKTIYIPVRITFNNPAEMSGDAYIKIENQENEYYRINFDSPSETTATNNKTSSPIKIARAKNEAVGTKPVTLLDSTSTFTLDTVRPNVINSFPVKLYLKLGKRAVGKDTVLNLAIKSDQPLQNLQLPDGDQKLKVKIDSADWNDTTDVAVVKTIDLQVQQTALVKSEQGLKITLKGVKDNGKHVVKIMPYKTKGKNDLLQLVESGGAEIVAHRTSAITRDFPSSVNLIDTIIVKVKLHGEYSSQHNQLVFAFLDTTLSKHFQILENPIEITENEWKASQKTTDTITNPITNEKKIIERDGSIDIPLHIRSVAISDSLKNIQRMDLIIKGQNQALRGSQRIKINTMDKPFWAEIGMNFDLLDNIKTNNFYAGVYMFDKDIAKFRLWGKDNGNNVSFTGGVYESQSVSSRSTNNLFDYKDGGSTILDTTTGNIKSYKTYRDTGVINSTTKIKRIGLFFSPHFRLTNEKTEVNGLHIFFSLHLEMLWQRVSSTIDYSKAKQTYIITTDTGATEKIRVAGLPYKNQSFDFDFRSHYLGVGLPLYIKENDFNLYLNPVLGLTTQDFAIISDYNLDHAKPGTYLDINNTAFGYDQILNIKRPKKTWNGFFLFQFRLNDVAYGITFSGEVRGITVQGAKPVITLALSKKFDLSGLLKPLVAPFK